MRTPTPFLLTSRNPYRVADSFLGQAIFDMDESHGEPPVPVIIGRAWSLGVNPGGQVLVCALPPEIAEDIPESFYDTLILHDYLGRINRTHSAPAARILECPTSGPSGRDSAQI